MPRAVLAVLALAACSGGLPAESSAEAPGDGGGAAPAAVTRLREVGRWKQLAVPIAVAPDGKHWLGAIDREVLTFDGGRVVARWPVMVSGRGATLQPLPGGRWFTGWGIVDGEGKEVWSGHAWAQRYGRFGSPKAMAVSPDGRIAIVDGADSPSACLCDRERGTSGSSAGALVRLTFVEGRAQERVLALHQGREWKVAASRSQVAAVEGRTLTVWPAAGDGAPTTVELDGTTLQSLRFAGERYLVGTRYVELDRTDVVVLDRDAGWRAVSTFPIAGMVRDLAIRPGGAELAVAFDNYRATDRVWVDDRKVAVFALDGTRRAEVDVAGHPAAVAWSPRGDTLLVSTTGSREDEGAVIRYRTR